VILHVLEEIVDLDVGVAVVTVLDLGALCEQGVFLIEEQNRRSSLGGIENSSEILQGEHTFVNPEKYERAVCEGAERVSLTRKQKAFAHEYSVDHSGKQAAIRAGYSEKTAKNAASRLMANVAVKQLVEKIDRDTFAAAGLDAAEMLREAWHESTRLQPKIHRGKPVAYVGANGEVREVVEFVSDRLASKVLDIVAPSLGLGSQVTTTEAVVYTLTLGDLSQEGET
jgi:hypothetical protein